MRVRVPAILHTVEADRALLLEYVPGTRLTSWLRRNYLALPRWCEQAVRDLGRWLAAYHERRHYFDRPHEFVAGHHQLVGRYLDDAAAVGRLAADQHAKAHRVLEAVLATIARQPVRLTWCHGDFALNNLIAYDEKLYIIDFTRYGKGPPEADLVCFWNSLRKEIGPFPFSSVARQTLWSALVEAYEEASAVKANTGVLDLWVLADLAYELAYAPRLGRLSFSWLRRSRLCAQTASYLRCWLDEHARASRV
jgi:aminoglycoside phosphotransferase (APT) family kinase protein